MNTRESLTDRQNRANTVFQTLRKHNPNAHIALRYTNPLELLVAVILSAQSTDVMINKVTEKLFQKYKTVDDYVHADIGAFEQDIKSSGFYHAKAKNILAAVKRIQDVFGGNVPKTMKDILTLPGVARKTANVVLGNAYGVVEGIAVDTHVLRVSQRLRLVDLHTIGGKTERLFEKDGKKIVDFKKDADPVKIEQELMEIVPKSDWFSVTYLLIDHGRAVCKAQNPDCRRCVLRTVCPVSRV